MKYHNTKCAIEPCGYIFRKNSTIRLFSFPKKPDVLESWFRICDIPRDVKVKNLRVCSQHFIRSDYSLKATMNLAGSRTRLIIDDALPKITLPQAIERENVANSNDPSPPPLKKPKRQDITKKPRVMEVLIKSEDIKHMVSDKDPCCDAAPLDCTMKDTVLLDKETYIKSEPIDLKKEFEDIEEFDNKFDNVKLESLHEEIDIKGEVIAKPSDGMFESNPLGIIMKPENNIQVEEIYIKQEKVDDSSPLLVNKEVSMNEKLIPSNTEETTLNQTSSSHSRTSLLFNKNLWKNLHNVKTEKIFKCELCTKTFPSYGRLRDHQNIHAKFECEVCHKKVARINEHMLLHDGGHPFKCEECSRWFRTAKALKYHSLTHTGERPFKCTICDKAFKKNFLLQMHIATHTGEKKFECDKCSEKFHINQLLKRHKKFQCTGLV